MKTFLQYAALGFFLSIGFNAYAVNPKHEADIAQLTKKTPYLAPLLRNVVFYLSDPETEAFLTMLAEIDDFNEFKSQILLNENIAIRKALYIAGLDPEELRVLFAERARQRIRLQHGE